MIKKSEHVFKCVFREQDVTVSKKGSFICVLMLYKKMREEVLSPNNFTYPFVLKAVGGLRAMAEAGEVHARVVKSGFEFDA